MIRTASALLSAAALAAAVPAVTAYAQQAGAPAPDPVFAAKLRAALRADPGIVIQALQQAQELGQKAQAEQINAKVAQFRPELFAKTPFGPTVGNPRGSRTVVELLDYACPFCKKAHDSVDDIVKTDKDVRVVIVMRPILGPESEVLARFALAADLQGRFPQAHDALYAKFGDDHQTHATDDNLRQVATAAGVDFDRAKRDMTGDKVEAVLQKHTAIGDKMEVRGTPFFVFPKGVIPGYAPEDQMKAQLSQ